MRRREEDAENSKRRREEAMIEGMEKIGEREIKEKGRKGEAVMVGLQLPPKLNQ